VRAVGPYPRDRSGGATAIAFGPRLTPELSRAAKRLRLERIVRRPDSKGTLSPTNNSPSPRNAAARLNLPAEAGAAAVCQKVSRARKRAA